MSKKREDDKISISKMKRSNLIPLWLAWQSRPDIMVESMVEVVPVPNNNNEVPHNHNDQQINVDCDNDTGMEDDHGNITMI